jgi:hypothetical protein
MTKDTTLDAIAAQGIDPLYVLSLLDASMPVTQIDTATLIALRTRLLEAEAKVAELENEIESMHQDAAGASI